MVYTSPSLALASVELFVHLDPTEAPNDMVAVEALIPDELLVEHILTGDLPRDWRGLDHPIPQKLGADWISSRRSVALEVPSAAVMGEYNVLLNPDHPDFGKIAIKAPVEWRFDERMFRRGI